MISFDSSRVNPCGERTAKDVREILVATNTADFRQLGCPESIFQRVLERRAARFKRAVADPVVDVSSDGPLTEKEISMIRLHLAMSTDLFQRISALETYAESLGDDNDDE